MRHIYLLLSVTVLALNVSHAQLPYRVDSSYGVNGIAIPSFNQPPIYYWLHMPYSSALQSDGKIVFWGSNTSSDMELIRLKANGTLDSTFNNVGYLENNAPGIGPANMYTFSEQGFGISPAGNIITALRVDQPGGSYSNILCYLPNGTLNTAFGTAGRTTLADNYAMCMAIDANNRTFVAGYYIDNNWSKYMVFCLKANGKMDSSFATNGLLRCPQANMQDRNSSVSAIKVMANGQILIAGNLASGPNGWPDSIFIARYNTNGTPDNSFGINGVAKYASDITPITQTTPGTIDVDASGNVFITNALRNTITLQCGYAIIKLSAAGVPVAGYGQNGYLALNGAFAIYISHEGVETAKSVLQSDGKMIVSGTSDTSATSSFKAFRLNADGTQDTTFWPGGGTLIIPRNKRDVNTNILMQADGKIVLSGYYRIGEAVFDTSRAMMMRFTNEPPVNTAVNNIKKQALSFNAYPNPSVNGAYHLVFNSALTKQNAVLALYDLTGKMIGKTSLIITPGSYSTTYHLPEGTVPGTYYLQLTGSDGEVSSLKLIYY